MIKLNAMTKTQKAIAIICIVVLALSTYLMIQYRDKIFVQKITIEYPDRCVEVFKNGVAITPLCINGRAILENKSVGSGEPIYIEPRKPIFNETKYRPNITIT